MAGVVLKKSRCTLRRESVSLRGHKADARIRKGKKEKRRRIKNELRAKKKKTIFFNANFIAFSLGKTKKLNDQIKAFEKILKS